MDTCKKNKIKQKIETCYVDRLIYDAIHQENELAFDVDNTTQDEGHIHRMKETLDDFKTCFPNTILHVQVEFDAHLPIKLFVTKTLILFWVHTRVYCSSLSVSVECKV